MLNVMTLRTPPASSWSSVAPCSKPSPLQIPIAQTRTRTTPQTQTRLTLARLTRMIRMTRAGPESDATTRARLRAGTGAALPRGHHGTAETTARARVPATTLLPVDALRLAGGTIRPTAAATGIGTTIGIRSAHARRRRRYPHLPGLAMVAAAGHDRGRFRPLVGAGARTMAGDGTTRGIETTTGRGTGGGGRCRARDMVAAIDRCMLSWQAEWKALPIGCFTSMLSFSYCYLLYVLKGFPSSLRGMRLHGSLTPRN